MTRGLQSHASVPLVCGEERAGILNVARPGETPFSREDLERLAVVGHVLCAALSRIRAQTREARRAALVRELNALVRRLQRTQDPERVLAQVSEGLRALNLNAAIALLDVASGSIVLRHTTVGGNVLQQLARLTGRPSLAFRVPQERSAIGLLAEKGEPVVEEAMAVLQRAFPHLPLTLLQKVADFLNMSPQTRVLHLPLRVGDALLGVLSVWGMEWDEPTVEVLSLFATQVAAAFHVAQVHRHTGAPPAEVEPEPAPASYRDWIEHAPVGLYRARPDGRLLDVNPAFARLFGFASTEDALGQNLRDRFARPADWEQRTVLLEEHGTLYGFEVRLRRLDGSTFWGREFSRCVRDAQGRIRYHEGGFEDITLLKEAEDILRRERDRLALYTRVLTEGIRAHTLDEALRRILEQVIAFLGVPMGAIFLVEGDQVLLRAWQGLPDTLRSHLLAFRKAEAPAWLSTYRHVQEPLSEEGETPRFMKDAGVQAWMTIPVHPPTASLDASTWLASLWVADRDLHAFDEGAQAALRDLSSLLAWIILHLTTVRQAQERLVRLQTLRDIDRAIVQRLDLQEILRIVLERIPQELGAGAAAISLLDPNRRRTEVFLMRLPEGALVEEEAFSLADSLLHWFVERQEPVIIYDLTQDPRVQMHRDRIRNGPLVSYLGVPLIVRGQTIGVLHILTNRPTVFAEEDVHFFRTLAGQAAIAIANARAFAEAQSRARALQRMLDTQLSLSSGDVASWGHALSEAWRDITGADRVGFFVYDPATQTLCLAESLGCPEEAAQTVHPRLTFHLGEPRGIAGLVGLTRKPVYVEDTQAHPHWVPLDPTIRSAYFVPVAFGERLFGVVSLLSTQPRAFSEQARALADLFARLVSTTLENARLLGETQRHARRLEALNAIIRAATEATDLVAFLDTVLERTLEALELSIGALWIREHAALRGIPVDFGLAIRRAALAARLDLNEPIIVDDWHTLPSDHPCHALRPIMEAEGIRASLTLPVYVDGEQVGGLSVMTTEPRAWRREDVDLALAVANEVDAAVSRLFLFQEARERAARIARLAALTEDLNRAHHVTDVVAHIGQGAKELAGATAGVVFVRQPDGIFPGLWWEGVSQAFVERVATIPPDQLPGGNLAESPHPVLVADVRTLPEKSPLRQLLEQEGIGSQMVWPLVYEGETIAVVSCYYPTPRSWSPLDQEVMATFSRHAAIALRNAQLLENLERTNQELQKALQAREDMIRNVTHELRTPLTMVRGYAELIEMGIVHEPEEVREHARIIIRHAVHLEHLINQMLLFQRLLQGEPLPTLSLDIAAWLRDVCQDWETVLRNTSLRLVAEIPRRLPRVQAHPEYLRQVMDNLLDNARKFSPEGGTITVRAWQQGNEVYVAVSDEGVGIPPEHLDRIFDRFYQVDPSPTRRFGGMGIGLALAKEIITLHGGRIWAESAGPGRGTTITFTLRVAED